MKIGILTIHFGVNHGSVLQAYALNKFLSSSGNDVKTINYIPKRYRVWNTLYKEKRNKYPLFVLILYYPVALIRSYKGRYIFKTFLDDNLPLTNRIGNIDGLRKIASNFDCLIVGSDQVWNEDYNGKKETAYYLDFVPKEINKIAYAASFGKDKLSSESEYERIGKYLSSFSRLSVREEEGIEILSKMGLYATHVVDPVFLLDESEWLSFANDNIKINGKYILVYVMDGLYDTLLINAELIKIKLGCKIVVVSFYKIIDKRIDIMLYNITPDSFVNLVHNSEFVITNSFHGTAFSILMGKRALIIGKNKYNSRIKSLLPLNRLPHVI